ncbi:MAG: bifunctional DNA primase/polymerase [Halarsenatibacteraceae bacterium]
MFIIPKELKTINNNKQIAAVEMARRGFHLLPLQPKSKIPYFELLPGSSWKAFKDYRAGVEQVNSWFKYDKDINIGMITGIETEPNFSLIVIDFDIEPEIGLPITPIVKTSRGIHAYFKCRTDKLPAAHKTARGEIKTSGYVVAPPSIHPSGDHYQWFDYLSFLDEGLADFDDRRQQIIKYLEANNQQSKQTEKTVEPTININSRFKGLESESEGVKKGAASVAMVGEKFIPTNDPEENKAIIKEIGQNKAKIVRLVSEVFDVNVKRIGQAFSCPLHSEKNPSAALFRSDDGTIGFKDFHRSGNYYTLPELYFEYKTGKQKKLKGGTSLIWFIRLLNDGGLIDIPKIIPPKPVKDLSENQKALYLGLIELLEVQQAYKNDQIAAPFSRTFAADWTGLKRSSVASAKRDLVNKGYIEKVVDPDRAKMKAGKWNIVRN